MAAGTIQVTNNSKAVVGVGTTFTAYTAGDFLSLVVGQVPYTVAIASIESATALTLVLPFDGPTATGLAWDGVKRDTMSLATMGVTVQAQKALRLMIADENNWRAIFGDAEEITITLPNGQVMQGMSWGYLSELLKSVDPVEMRDLAAQATTAKNDAVTAKTGAETARNQANTARDQANTAKTGAETAKTGAETAKTGAETARDQSLSYRNQAEQFANSVNPDNILDQVGVGANTRHLPDINAPVKGFCRIIAGQTAGADGFSGAGWIAGYDGSPSYTGMFVQPDGNRIFAGGKSPAIAGGLWQWHEVPTIDRANTFTRSQEILASYPGLELTTTALNNNNLGKTILIENDAGDALNFFYKMLDDDTGRYTIRLPKPGYTTTMTIGLDGGLAPNGNSFNIGASQGLDFSVGQQGWRSVGGDWANGPSSGGLFGAVFTHAVQGLNVGGYSANGTDNHWFIQRFYDTSANIFTRVQVNDYPWGNWYKVTTSAVSDERLKDIKGNLNVEGALDNINRMEFKLFSFKNEKSKSKLPITRRGVISQQIRLIDKEYTTEVGGFYHLDQTPLLLDGLAAIKALRARDEANKAEIAELKAAVAELKAAVSALSKA